MLWLSDLWIWTRFEFQICNFQIHQSISFQREEKEKAQEKDKEKEYGQYWDRTRDIRVISTTL